MRASRKGHWGFGLIEILVTLGVLSVGILGVTVLHSTVTEQSSENKSRAEALAIAQSRIEEMRNYTGEVASLAAFNTQFPNTSGFANNSTVYGTNASFTRSEQIGSSGELKTLSVKVEWSDSDNVTQSVVLNTRISYIPPRSIGDTALSAATSIVDAPTGRARLGDGELPADVELSSLAYNGDGTYLYDEGTERMLVTEDEEIVLTLQEACQTDGTNCTDFVRIRGRVYIDQSSQSSLNPGEVYVIASDAAFCARYYTPASTPSTPNPAVQRVIPTTTNTRTTATGSYEYFDYKCYIGGGWHGNIGILLAGGLGNQDKICIGDPVTTDAWATPIIASRRVYRGMLYKPVATSTTTITTENGVINVEGYTSSSGSTVPRFYSQGIADATQIPAPNSSDPTHDFVIGSFQQNLTDGSNCETQGVMVRTDATVNGVTGGLFINMPTDFVCLNDGQLDNYDNEYAHTDTCPYDPSDPPSSSHKVSGSLRLDADDTAANDIIAATIAMHTSDGPGNCNTTAASPAHDGTYYQFTYSCDVYNWGNGWNGYIEADYDAAEMECDPYQLTLTSVTSNSSNHNFTTCTTGSFAVIKGRVTQVSGNRKLATASMGSSGACTLDADKLGFECISNEYTGPTMTFTITFTATSGVVCSKAAPHNSTASHPFVNQPAGNVLSYNLKIANNSGGCP